jgi:hypothetical protein
MVDNIALTAIKVLSLNAFMLGNYLEKISRNARDVGFLNILIVVNVIISGKKLAVLK